MSRNIIQSNGNIVEKILRDKEGKLIRARFFVYVDGGRIKARLLDFIYLAEQVLLNGVNFVLSGIAKAKSLVSKLSFVKAYNSPFTILNTIYFSGSKPRAPSLI